MSWKDANRPECRELEDSSPIEMVLTGTVKHPGAFTIRRVLPSDERQRVGPFIFFDHFGPSRIEGTAAMDVRPHPHINLATISYLFEGAILHRDSLGVEQRIEPGAINLMVAGRGITHSERTPADMIGTTYDIHGLQLWIALPIEHEETEPAFYHHPADTLPVTEADGVMMRQMMGSAFGMTSPVKTFSPMFYTDVRMRAGASLTLPDVYEDRAAYLLSGELGCGEETFAGLQMVLFRAGRSITIEAKTDTHVVLLGGARLVGERTLWWNFVSSDPIRLEAAKKRWKDHQFPLVPGDTEERIPLPEEAPHIERVQTAEGGAFIIFQHGEQLGEMTWRWAREGLMDILHTGVEEALAGKGWARRLVETGVQWAREQEHVQILPHCPYARSVITADPHLRDMLWPNWQELL